MALLPKILRTSDEQRRNNVQRDLIRYEAKIGGKLFGPTPPNRQRDFFCLDRHTWVWHEQWHDQQGKSQSVTTRYEFRPSGVLKVQNDHVYQSLSIEEATNLYRAIELYMQRIKPMYQKQLQAA